MASYNYKYVRDLLPPYLTTEMEDYEGTVDYNGDQWVAASEYINALETEVAKQVSRTGFVFDEQLIKWLKTRPKTFYNEGPAIK